MSGKLLQSSASAFEAGPLKPKNQQASKRRASTVASFRISPEARAVLVSRAVESGLSIRAWQEQAIIENRAEIVAVAKPHPELRLLVFQSNKVGNNLNQSARHFNSLRLQGKLSEIHCEEALDLLSKIQGSFKEVVAHARSR